MCVTCGCSSTDATDHGHAHVHTRADGSTYSHSHGISPDRADAHEHAPGHGHTHGRDGSHGHSHSASHEHDHGPGNAHDHGRTISLERDLLAANQLLAERNRGWFAGRGILALNLVSSPGSGKTSVLERTIRDLRGQLSIGVIEGDQATSNDAQRIRAAGAPAVQINTGTGCHLDAGMLARGLGQLAPATGSVVLIENVGNLVCPALFDLGEHAKVLILSVTEGEDKPIKYPHMFRAARLMLLNKTDLLPHVDFDVERCIAHARSVNPDIEVLQVSARSGHGMQAWYAWLQDRLSAARADAPT